MSKYSDADQDQICTIFNKFKNWSASFVMEISARSTFVILLNLIKFQVGHHNLEYR